MNSEHLNDMNDIVQFVVETYGNTKYHDPEGVVVDWIFLGLYCDRKGQHYLVPHEAANKKHAS